MRNLKFISLSAFLISFAAASSAFAATQDFVRNLNYSCDFEGNVAHHGTITCTATGEIHAAGREASGTMNLDCTTKKDAGHLTLTDSSVEFKAQGNNLAVIGEENSSKAAVVLKAFLPDAVAGEYSANLIMQHQGSAIHSLSGSCHVTNIPTNL